jgi:pimeloyl-ACP methyl ester carboxylesterase
VVLVHASGYSANAWRRVAGELAPSYRTVAPHLVGYGQSGPFDEATFTVDDDVAVVAAVLDGLAEPAHLVGHSYGGVVALRLARERAADLLSLALLEPVAFGVLYAAGDDAGLGDLVVFDGAPAFWDPATGGSAEWLAPFVEYWHGPGAWRAMEPAQRVALERFGRKIFFEVSAVSRDRTSAEEWAVHSVPTLVLRGARTTLASLRVTERLAAAFEHGRLEEIDGAGHLFPHTHPEAVADRLRAHFAAVRS